MVTDLHSTDQFSRKSWVGRGRSWWGYLCNVAQFTHKIGNTLETPVLCGDNVPDETYDFLIIHKNFHDNALHDGQHGAGSLLLHFHVTCEHRQEWQNSVCSGCLHPHDDGDCCVSCNYGTNFRGILKIQVQGSFEFFCGLCWSASGQFQGMPKHCWSY